MDQETILKQFGLEELRTGKHIIRNGRRWREDELLVSGIWQAIILPSFHQEAIITTIHFQEHEYRGKYHPKQILSLISLRSDLTLIKPIVIENDPVVPNLRNVNLFPSRNFLCLDGISYSIEIHLNEIEGSLLLHNPTDPSFVKIVSSLFSLAKEVQKRSKRKEIEQYLEEWQKYLRK